jgi:hypothetical protein
MTERNTTMVDVATWRMDPEHLEQSVQALREYMDEDGASLLLKAGDSWLPLIDVQDDSARAQEWEEAVEAICFEGDCSTTLSFLEDVVPGPVRVCHDDAVDGIVLFIGERPVLAIAGEAMSRLPEGLLHLEAADLSLESLERAARFAGSSLISLDVGGNEELTSSSPDFVMHFPNLRALDISSLEKLETLTPLAMLTKLSHLDLADCAGLTDLRPLSKVTTLTSLTLSGCCQVTSLEPLSDLPTLSSIDLSDCERLPDLKPLVRILSLTRLDLSGSKKLESVAVLRACGKLQSLSLAECPNIKDLSELGACASLSSLELDDVELVMRVLARTAVLRVDPAFVELRRDTWLTLLEASPSPGIVQDLLPAFCLGLPETWAVEAVTGLVERVKKARIEDAATWQKIFVSLRLLGDPAWRPSIELAVQKLEPGVDVTSILVPALDMLSRIPSTDSASSWAHALVDSVLDPLVTSPRGKSISEAAVRYYARAGRLQALDPWLDIVTRRTEPATAKQPRVESPKEPDLEKDPAALSGMVARLIQKSPDSPAVAQLVAALVGLGRQDPASRTLHPFVEHFSSLIRTDPNHPTAEHFGEIFLSVVREHPEGALTQRLFEEIVELATRHPDSPTAKQFREMLEAASEAGIVQFARSALDHPALREKASPELERFVASFSARDARGALLRGVIQGLNDEDIVGNKARMAVLARLEEALL